MEQTDEEIAELVQKGDTESFGVLLDRYEKKLTRYARKFLLFDEEGTDMVQDVFIKAYANIQSFDTKQRFSPWVYRIAHNEFINEIKRREKAPLSFFDGDTIFPQPKAEEETDRMTLEKESKQIVNSSLEKLEDKYKAPLVLHFYEYMSYQDISEILRIPVSTVGVRISRGKKKLKELDEIKQQHD